MDGQVADLSHLSSRFSEALAARVPIFAALEAADTDSMRLFQGAPDGIPGWVVDKFGSLAWIQYREGECSLRWEEAKQLAELVHAALASRGVGETYLKRYVPDRSRLPNLAREMEFEYRLGDGAEPRTGLENGVRFRVLPSETFSPGLFLDQRSNRAWVREVSSDRRVLNLFSYTGVFSVFAALGGAKEVITVDSSKKWLDVARANFELNAVPGDSHRFFATGALGFLETAAKRSETYDLIIADPPSFSRSERDGVFSLSARRQELWDLAMSRLNPGGIFLFSCNWQQTNSQRLLSEVFRTVSTSTWRELKLPAAPQDFIDNGTPITAFAIERLA